MSSSQTPVGGNIDLVLGITFENGDQIAKYVSVSTVTYTYNNGTWSPSVPSIGLSEGFYTMKINARAWRQNLSIW